METLIFMAKVIGTILVLCWFLTGGHLPLLNRFRQALRWPAKFHTKQYNKNKKKVRDYNERHR